MAKKLRVAVLMGGCSSEREVSLASGAMVVRHLDPAKYDVLPFDTASLHRLDGASAHPLPGPPPTADLTALAAVAPRALERDSAAPPVEVAFIALHGRGGEDGTIQGLLELLGIPYTGSGVLASALAMDKVATKKMLLAAGIPTPRSCDFRTDNGVDTAALAAQVEAALRLPVVVKPVGEGSSVGMTIVREAGELPAAIAAAGRCDTHVLVEEFVTGVEITAALLGNREPEVLPLVEIVPKSGVYDYAAKYDEGATDEIVPARIAEDAAAKARALALAAFQTVGCRGVGRVDMIVGPDGPVVLEVNTIPGFTATSLVPRAAQAAGISFPQLLDRIIELALEER